jgi:hypothetical protein
VDHWRVKSGKIMRKQVIIGVSLRRGCREEAGACHTSLHRHKTSCTALGHRRCAHIIFRRSFVGFKASWRSRSVLPAPFQNTT